MIQPSVRHLRTGAAVAALVLAVLSRGDAVVLAGALAVVAWRPAGLALIPAVVAGSWRWGSTSLEAVAGAQAVLGSAVTVGPTSAAVASGLAGAAVLLTAAQPAGDDAPPPFLTAAAVGASVAVVAAGPAPGGDLWQRVLVALVAGVAAIAVGRMRVGARRGVGLDGLGAVAAIGALVAASLDAPGWSGTVDDAAVAEGLVVAAAAVALVVVGSAAMGHRRG